MKNDLLQRLRSFGQEHLLRFWDVLNDRQRESLAAQLNEIDFELISRLATQQEQAENWADLAARATSPPAIRLDGVGNRFSAAEARGAGERALRSGEIGAVLVAGGQGTRLGFDHPKGMYPIGPVSNATLFQILFEKLIAAGRRYGVAIPLYLMTSPATHEETVANLAEQRRFGLAEDDLKVFCQGTMPAIDQQTGRLLLAAKGRLFLSPDGHGGMLAALDRSGGLEDVRRRGIRRLFYFQVDNPLVTLGEPEFIGYHVLAGSEMTTQVIRKQDPAEKVGVVVSVGGRTQVIEYSDLPAEAAARRDPDGSLSLWAGSIAVHVLDVDFLSRVAGQAEGLPFHIARKAVPYIDDKGELVEPENPNAIKFERFIFDLMPSARSALVVEVDQARAFAPLKNAPGSTKDSPEQVQAQMIALHSEWLRAAGAQLKEGVPVEICPLFALDAEQVAARVAEGTRVHEPTCFH
jgi:UDP-N-acetylglucosamine/UDP-N-acetylgalactosamine diphosphorylase